MAFIAVSDKERALAFYRDKLGLNFLQDERFALVFELGCGIPFRVIPGQQVPQVPYTIFGWQVSDIAGKIAELRSRGVSFEIFGFLPQDENGIWIAPGGAQIAWFKDPDGNTLSLTQFPG